MQGFDYNNLGGGVNAGDAADSLKSSEAAELINWYPEFSRLRRRGGVRRITTAAWDDQIVSMFPLRKSDGTWVLIVGGSGKFGKLDGTTIVDVPFGSGVGPVVTARPWKHFVYKDYLYAVRRGGRLLRIGDNVLHAGFAAPTGAPTIAQGVAGTLAAGDYKAVYTFYQRATAYESNPSAVSNTLTLGANRTIDYTGIGVSTNPLVDARRIYRTLAGQSGVYFFVHEIDDNFTTSISGEQVAIADMGNSVSFKNGLPPDTLETGVIWNDRLFATDGRDLYFSELLLIEGFSGDLISVFPDDGHEIRGLHPFGDRLIIGKTNKMHYLVGTSKSNFELHTLSDRHGCKSHHSMASAEGRLFWYGSGKTVLISDGTVPRDVSKPKVKPYLEAIPDELEEFVIGAVFEEKHWYVLSIPDASGLTENRRVLVYNYKSDVWTVFEHPGNAPQFIGDFFTENFGHILYASFYDNQVSHYNDEDVGTDFGDPIEASVTFRKDHFGHPGLRKAFDQVWLLIPRVSGGTPLNLQVLADEIATPIVNRNLSLDIANSEWKAYKVPTWGQPATNLQLKLTYTGTPAVTLDGVHFEVGVLGRRPKQPI